MKKLFTLALIALFAFAAQAQSSFSDDFESYNVGDLVGATSPKWETWGNTGTDDAPVTDEKAKSGTKSLKFVTSVAAGGPADVVCKFGGAYVSGNFEMSMNLFIVKGAGAYFNLQAENVVGTKWAADFFFNNQKLFVNGNGNTIRLLSDVPFPTDKWVNFKLTTDITNNFWEVFVDGVSAGKFSNTANKIASIDFYPTQQGGVNDNFYVDDFAYDYKPATGLPVNDGCLYTFAPRNFGLAGMTYPLWFEVRNTGTGVLTKFDIMVENGTDTIKQSYTGQTMASLSVKKFFINTGVYKLLQGNQQIRARLLKVGGVTNDGNPNNNARTVNANGLLAAQDKAVVVEEATGTWCQFCPRGHVFMDSLEKIYPGKFIGIAVHNGVNDPMVVPEYDQGMTSFPGFTGFPSVLINRDFLDDPGTMEIPFLEEIQKEAPVVIKTGAKFDAVTGELDMSVTANVLQDLNGDHALNLIIIENGLKGVGSGWAQVNAYAGGARGEMGGYEKKANPVPASQMTYNHVARALPGSYFGKQIPFAELKAGQKYHHNFKFVLTSAYKKDNIRLIGVIYDSEGKILNAEETTIDEAVAHGFVLDANNIIDETKVGITPNPADGFTQIAIAMSETAETSVRVYDMLGRQVSEQHYGLLGGEQLLTYNTATLEDGVYNFVIMAGKDAISQKVIVRH